MKRIKADSKRKEVKRSNIVFRKLYFEVLGEFKYVGDISVQFSTEKMKKYVTIHTFQVEWLDNTDTDWSNQINKDDFFLNTFGGLPLTLKGNPKLNYSSYESKKFNHKVYTRVALKRNHSWVLEFQTKKNDNVYSYMVETFDPSDINL